MNEEKYIEQFKKDYRFRFVPKYLYDIQIALEQLLAYCEKSIQDIHPRDIRNWMMDLQTNGYAKTTVRTKLYRLKRFFLYCLEEKIIKHNPLESISIPEERPQIPYYLEIDQLNRLRELVSGNLRQRAIIEVLYTTGVRLGELCAMKIEDIQWSERSILIQNGKGKKERIVLFTNECGEHLRAYLQERTDDLPYLFLNRYEKGPITNSAIHFWFENYRKELAIYMKPHTLRHTFAAHLAIKGMSQAYIQVLLGHDEPRHTEMYTRLYNEARKQQYDEWM